MSADLSNELPDGLERVRTTDTFDRVHHVDIADPVTFTLEFRRAHDRADIAPG